ncbi:MAG: hypothetical protein OEW19_03725 [Acidobacteriota bacterium]|nr:hypothetical protein [Acidobacteriota bacterium]
MGLTLGAASKFSGDRDAREAFRTWWLGRRGILRSLAALGFSGSLAESPAAQAVPVVSAEVLGGAAARPSGTFGDERLGVIGVPHSLGLVQR